MDIAVNARFLLPNRQLEGIGRYTDDVTKRLAEAHPEHQFHLLFDRAFDPRFISQPNVTPHVLHPPARHPVLFLAWFEVAVARWLKRHRPQVFFSPDGYTTLRTAVPRVTVIHDLAFEHFPGDIHRLQREYYLRMTPRFVAASTSILTVSEATKTDILATYDCDETKVHVAYPGVGAAFNLLTSGERNAQSTDRWSSGEDYFMFVGAIQPRKNLPRLLRSFDAFKTATGSAAKLLLVGRQAWKTEATNAVLDAMHHRRDVVLTGPVDDAELEALYGGALAVVFTSLFEGFGLPIIEAMSCRGPVITSNVSSMPEIAGGAALLVDPLDEAQLVQAMTRLATDPALREQLRTAGVERAAEFSWDRTAAAVWQSLEAAAAVS